MSNDLVTLARERKFKHRTHYKGCEAEHFECLVGKLADEVERLKALIWAQVAQAQWIADGWGPEPMTKEDKQAIDVIVDRLDGMALARAAMQAAVEEGHHE